MIFKLAPMTVRYDDGKLTIGRPGPPLPPPPRTLKSVLAERHALAKRITALGKNSFALEPGAEERLAALDAEIDKLAVE